jgi:PAS domain S-box-containing protein
MSAPGPIHVLVIEDDADTRSNLCDILELDQHRVDTAASVQDAFQSRDWSQYAAIILDRKLPDGTADEVLPRLRQIAPESAVLIVTGYADLAGAIAALRLGAADYILKPVNAEALRASIQRIAERRHLAREKERSEAAFRSLVEAAPCMIVILRADLAISYFSPFAEKLTGHQSPELVGKKFFSIFTADELRSKLTGQGISGILAGAPIRGLEAPIGCKHRNFCWMVWNAEVLKDYQGEPAVLLVGQDITKLKEAQEEALQATRLAAIGQMTAGLAHESRNALQLIQASLEMLALEVEDRPEALELVESIQAAEDRLHRLFEDVRGYAAPIQLERDVYDISRVWRGAWEQVKRARGGTQAQLREHTEGVDLCCLVDLYALERVFRNLFENSLAARADAVDISCAAVSLDGRSAIQISVRDNGPGFAPEQRQKVFQPFFTTKRQGTGLGMPIAKRIVEAHGGTLVLGEGTSPGAEVVIALPRGTATHFRI